MRYSWDAWRYNLSVSEDAAPHEVCRGGESGVTQRESPSFWRQPASFHVLQPSEKYGKSLEISVQKGSFAKFLIIRPLRDYIPQIRLRKRKGPSVFTRAEDMLPGVVANLLLNVPYQSLWKSKKHM